MAPETVVAWIAALGAVGTIGTVIYLAGRLEGRVTQRLHEIERRIDEVEHALRRVGFPVRARVPER